MTFTISCLHRQIQYAILSAHEYFTAMALRPCSPATNFHNRTSHTPSTLVPLSVYPLLLLAMLPDL